MKCWIWILVGSALIVGYAPVKAQDYARDIESAYLRAQVDSALGFAQAFVAAHPDSVDAHGFLGTLYAESGRLDDAIVSFQKIITLKPKTVKGYRDLALLYAQNGKVDVAVQTLNEGLEKSDQPVILRLERAALLRDTGDIQGALADFEQVIQEAPQLLDAYQSLALTYAGLDRPDKAIETMDRGVKANPDNVMLKVNRGGIFHSLGRPAGALKAYREAIAQAPEDPQVYRAMGFMAAEAESLQVAQQAWEKVRMLNPNDLEVRNALSQLYLALGQLDAAIGELQALIEMAPDATPVRFRLGEAYMTKGEFELAKSEFRACIQAAAEWTEPYKRLALIHLEQDLPDSAFAVYQKLLEMTSGDADIHNNLGFIYSLKGNLNEAKAAYQKAVDLSPNAETLRDAQNNLRIIESIQAGKIRARHILVKTEVEAQDVLQKLKGGGDFVSLARQYSIDPSGQDGGATGFFSPGDLHPDFEAAVMELKPNEISGVVQTPLGYHIIWRIN